MRQNKNSSARAPKDKARLISLGAEELSVFCSELSMLLAGGVTPEDALLLLEENEKEAGRRLLFHELSLPLSSGASLSASLSASGAFPKTLCSLIAVGEASGRLDEVLSSLARYYKRSAEIRESVKSAVAYPLIMTLMMFLVTAALLTLVMPLFSRALAQLGAQGGMTGLVSTGKTVGTILFVISGVLLLAGLLGFSLRNTCFGKRMLQNLFYHSIFTHRLSDELAQARFTYAMGLMLESGLLQEQAVSSAGELSEHPRFQAKVAALEERLKIGEDFAGAGKAAGLFTPLQAGMIAVGVRSGAIAQALQQVSDQCTLATQTRVARLIGAIEPTLVAVLALIIGGILLSVILPLMGILTAL